ncbi:MAG TPA: hypothetical protein PL124_12470 [Candidatus Cloacimonadota bacterium]|nr:hypothetical protein [Candidatus Cloacimonadota bacterium]
METDKKLFNLLLKASKEHKGLNGFKYIVEMWTHSGNPIPSTQLYTLDHAPRYTYVHDSMGTDYHANLDMYVYTNPEQPFPIIDEKTKMEALGLRNAIIYNLQIATENNDYAMMEYYQDQLDILDAYLHSSLDRRGNIRIVNRLSRNHASLIRHAVNKVLAAIKPKYPELVQYLNAHLVIGNACYFSEEEIVKRGKRTKTA